MGSSPASSQAWPSQALARALAKPEAVLAKLASSALLPTVVKKGSPTTINYRKKGALILTSPLEDLV